MDFLMLASDGRKVESDFDEGREVCLDIKLAWAQTTKSLIFSSEILNGTFDIAILRR